ncbi:hypothetical protein GJ496_010270 [Pomphorhynchus laevis]|nr:hypothetical protein GJ496_010270 [Pomphorhynchus laevis]
MLRDVARTPAELHSGILMRRTARASNTFCKLHIARTGSSLVSFILRMSKPHRSPGKKDRSIRPIGVGEVFRRLLSKCACIRLRYVFRDRLSPNTYGVVVEDGVVWIVHQVRAYIKFIICQTHGLALRQTYLTPSTTSTGRQFLMQYPAKFRNYFHWPCSDTYLDDGIIGGEPDSVCTALNMLDAQFQSIALLLNWGKTEIIGSLMVATVCGSKCRHPLVLNSTGDLDIFLDTYLPKLTDDLNSVSAIEDSRIAYLLLSKCCSASRVIHLMKTIDPQIFRPLTTRLDACVLDSLQKNLATHLDHNHRDQAALSARLEGLGLQRTTDHSTRSFVASVAKVASVVGLPCSHFLGFDSSFSD